MIWFFLLSITCVIDAGKGPKVCNISESFWNNENLVEYCNSFDLFYINRAYIQYFIIVCYSSRTTLDFLIASSRWEPLLGCRAEIRTRVRLTAADSLLSEPRRTLIFEPFAMRGAFHTSLIAHSFCTKWWLDDFHIFLPDFKPFSRVTEDFNSIPNGSKWFWRQLIFPKRIYSVDPSTTSLCLYRTFYWKILPSR
jgi:hypothetical protein